MKLNLAVAAIVLALMGAGWMHEDAEARTRLAYAENMNHYDEAAHPVYFRACEWGDRTLCILTVADFTEIETVRLADSIAQDRELVRKLRSHGFRNISVLGRDEVVVVRKLHE